MTTTLAEGSRKTPLGAVRFAVDDGGAVVALAFDDRAVLAPSRAAAPTGDALDAYFAGNLAALDALRVAPRGTDFQRRVWTALGAIPAGSTASYADVALAIGAPRAVRAVGAANGANPVAIIVPCHRVIGRDGSLTGYAGGIDRKAWLLAHEASSQLPPSPKRHTPMPLHPFAGGGQSPLVQQR